jgi:hypothetical protein
MLAKGLYDSSTCSAAYSFFTNINPLLSPIFTVCKSISSNSVHSIGFQLFPKLQIHQDDPLDCQNNAAEVSTNGSTVKRAVTDVWLDGPWHIRRHVGLNLFYRYGTVI